MRWVGHVVNIEEIVCIRFWGIAYLEDPDAYGSQYWKQSLQKRVWGVGWINMAQGRAEWALLNVVINL